MLARPTAGVVRPAAPLFSFGVIADVQYADIPDGRSFLGVPRYYRHSMAVLRRAVRSWNANKEDNVRFCLNFGDIVDGLCPKDQSLEAVRAVVREFDAFRRGPAYHMLGNHCLYNLPRADLVSELRMPSPPGRAAYYDFSPSPGWRFAVLDAYDFSAVGWPPGLRGGAAVPGVSQPEPRQRGSPARPGGSSRSTAAWGTRSCGGWTASSAARRGAAGGEGRRVQPPAGAPRRRVADGAHVELRGGDGRGAPARGVRRGVARRARP